MTNNQLQAHFKGKAGGFEVALDFNMPLQGVTALFGSSGSGKTTILRAIAGLHALDGSLTVGSETWQDSARDIFIPPHKRAIGYVFQEASLFPHLDVRQNVLFGAKRAGKNGSNRTALSLENIVKLVDIEGLLDRSPSTLSGGERQRVAVARALIHKPRLLLMDEPLSALDRRGREEVLSCLETLHKELSIPMLYVSHDFSEVARLADHMVLVDGGRKLAEGPARTLFEQLDFQAPDGQFETSVVLKATVSRHCQNTQLTHLQLGPHDISLPLLAAHLGNEILLRVRSRDVALATIQPKGISIRNIIAGKISDISDEAGLHTVEVQIDVGAGHLRSQITRDAYNDLGLCMGKPVYALVKSMSLDGYQQ